MGRQPCFFVGSQKSSPLAKRCGNAFCEVARLNRPTLSSPCARPPQLSKHNELARPLGMADPHCGQRRATPRRPLPLPFATSTRASSNASREPNARQASDTPPGAGLAVTITPRSPRLSQASAAAYTSPNRQTQMAKRAPLSSAKQTCAAIVSETNAPAKPARNSLGHSGRSQARFPTPSAGPAAKVCTFAPKRKPSAGAAQLCALLLAQQT